MSTRIVILAVDCQFTNILYNSLKERYEIEKVIIERPIPKSQFLGSRIRRLGLSHVIGQILFQLLIVPFLKMSSINRVEEIKGSYQLNDMDIDSEKILHIDSVNSPSAAEILEKLKPGLIIINGTRIIRKELLDRVPTKFINIHTGITPLYRGVHGGYWALVDNDPESCGVTIHYVDQGIDTGGIIKQGSIKTNEKDNYITYPFIQFGVGLSLLKGVIRDIEDGIVETASPSGRKSKLWSHPTFFGYLRHRINNKVK